FLNYWCSILDVCYHTSILSLIFGICGWRPQGAQAVQNISSTYLCFALFLTLLSNLSWLLSLQPIEGTIIMLSTFPDWFYLCCIMLHHLDVDVSSILWLAKEPPNKTSIEVGLTLLPFATKIPVELAGKGILRMRAAVTAVLEAEHLVLCRVLAAIGGVA
ncbi:hypothetical protein L9F63_006417, partial [Diploptera punctata]